MLLIVNPVLLPCGVHVYSGESSWLCPSVCQFVCLYMWNVSFRFRSPFEGKYTFMAVTTLSLSVSKMSCSPPLSKIMWHLTSA